MTRTDSRGPLSRFLGELYENLRTVLMILTAVVVLDVLAWVSSEEESPRMPHGSVDPVVGVNMLVYHHPRLSSHTGRTIIVGDGDRSVLFTAAGEYGGHDVCKEGWKREEGE